MLIREAAMSDMPVLLEIYERARNFMKSSGNPNQWTNGYPNEKVLKEDIDKHELFVAEEDGVVHGCFVFYIGIDPCYLNIYDGQWLNDEEYGVIHRIATRGLQKGVGQFILSSCLAKVKNLRMDTHEDNKVMQNLLIRNGFVHVGTIYLKNGQSRLAFHCNLLDN